MRKLIAGVVATLAAGAWIVVGLAGQAPASGPPRTTEPAAQPERGLMPRLYKLEDNLLEWALPPGEQAYASIDGKRMYRYVVEQAMIARRYRDQGHQLWGRVIGTSSDAESAQWLLAKYKQLGLTDTRIQPIDLVPQWTADSWEVSVTGGGKTVPVTSATPAYYTPGTKPEGLDLEAVYVGLGSEADFAGRDVRGKAAVIFSMPRPESGAAAEGALKRAEQKGAAAIFDVINIPGNLKYMSYPTSTNVPTFALGMQDGRTIRDLVGKASAGQAPHLRIHLTTRMVPNLKTALVWATLPGATDETIYIIAHRDGWFDAATDNASGVAGLIELAEHYSKIPRAERRRTMVFIGTDGHHNTGPGFGAGREWLVAHRNDGMFAKTALMINVEHPSTMNTYIERNNLRWSNIYTAQQWYAGGPTRPKLQEIAIKAFKEFGVGTYAEPEPVPPGGDLGRFYWFLPGVATSDFHHYFHMDGETPETVPWTGLEATIRSYAKVIDEVNRLELSDLQRPALADPRPPAPTTAASR